jgi:hypothetical protein
MPQYSLHALEPIVPLSLKMAQLSKIEIRDPTAFAEWSPLRSLGTAWLTNPVRTEGGCAKLITY